MMGAPTDLVDLGHGRGQLRAAPAASVFRIDKRLGRPVQITSSYRDYDEQQKARDKWLRYSAYIKYINGGPWAPWAPEAPLALDPEDSWHCRGMAADTNEPQHFRREDGWDFIVPSERWHGQYYAALDRHANEPAGGGSQPFPPTTPDVPPILKGDDMFGYWLGRLKGDSKVWMFDPWKHTKRHISTRDEKAAIELAYKQTTGKTLVVVEYTDLAQINGYKNV